MENGTEDWSGHLTIEGWLLEMAYSALCVAREETVVPRYETLGIIHDILLDKGEGYVFCECVGESGISNEKLEFFENSVLTLNSRLSDFKSERPVMEARLVTISDPETWKEEQREKLASIRKNFEESSVKLVVESSKRLLYEFISRSILGFGMVDNKIFFAGPNERAIRYDRTSSRFGYHAASIDYNTFRKLPQSFLPRDYWSQRYRNVFEETVSSEYEKIPEWFEWQFPDNFGITWKSAQQLKEAVIDVSKKKGAEPVYENVPGFLSIMKLAKAGYYTANVVHCGGQMHRNEGKKIRDELSTLIRSAKAHSKVSPETEAYLRIFTDTTTFSPDYWSSLGYSSYNGRIVYPEILRGDEVLRDSLNYGTLGIKLTGNKITLSTSDESNVMKIEHGALKWESGESTYPAQLKF